MSFLKSVDSSLFFPSRSLADPRLGQICRKETLLPQEAEFVIIGYPDDEGVKLNGGRPGAKDGPSEIRKALYRMTPNSTQFPVMWDAGNISTDVSLSQRHEKIIETLLPFYHSGKKIISLGGGHDYGYPDVASFLKAHQKSKIKPLVVNFDAHLDVRPTDNGIHSGTPFFRILEEFKNFHFFEVGIQDFCNSPSHMKWAKKKKAKIYKRFELPLFLKAVKPLLKAKTPVFLSVDMDVFSTADAPGVSQSWGTGVAASEFLPIYIEIIKKSHVQGLGLYETSPPHDVSSRTSRLAATLIYHYMSGSL